MNRIIILTVAALALAGCVKKPDAETQAATQKVGEADGYDINVWTDPQTGCEFYVKQGFVTQRFNADGSARCRLRVDPADLAPTPPADPRRAKDLTGRRAP